MNDEHTHEKYCPQDGRHRWRMAVERTSGVIHGTKRVRNDSIARPGCPTGNRPAVVRAGCPGDAGPTDRGVACGAAGPHPAPKSCQPAVGRDRCRGLAAGVVVCEWRSSRLTCRPMTGGGQRDDGSAVAKSRGPRVRQRTVCTCCSAYPLVHRTIASGFRLQEGFGSLHDLEPAHRKTLAAAGRSPTRRAR